MSKLFDRICEASALAWLKFVQGLNGIAVALLGGALIVHQSYPHLIASLLTSVPEPLKIAALFVFGTLVHFALRRAKKTVEK